MTKNQWTLTRIGLGCGFLLASLLLEYLPSLPSWCEWVELGVALAGYLLVGYDVIWSAFRRIIRGSFLDENFLMVIASVGAFVIGEYPEALAVMLFYQVGEYFEHYAVGKSRRSIQSLLAINADTARLADSGEEMECEEIEIKRIENSRRIDVMNFPRSESLNELLHHRMAEDGLLDYIRKNKLIRVRRQDDGNRYITYTASLIVGIEKQPYVPQEQPMTPVDGLAKILDEIDKNTNL